MSGKSLIIAIKYVTQDYLWLQYKKLPAMKLRALPLQLISIIYTTKNHKHSIGYFLILRFKNANY